ncbi:MAG: carboxypeptidase regulatory-like domain-containing protein [Thermoplasmatota archaeon]
MRLLPVFLFLMLALAGCSSKDAAPAPQEEEVPEGNAINGVVVTPTIQPIPGAKVTLTPGDAQDTADLFGRFRFDELESGTYRIRAEVDGYEVKQVTVKVTDGETARPRIVMEPILPPVARHDTITFNGFIKSNFGQADEASEPYKEHIGMDGCECQFYFTVPRYTHTITVEVIWDDAVAVTEPAPQPEYRWSVSTLSLSHFAEGQGASPILANLDADTFGGIDFSDAGAMTIRIRGDENVPTTDQGFQVFVTIWEVTGPPSGWAIANGDS